jgi:hypothetical protein
VRWKGPGGAGVSGADRLWKRDLEKCSRATSLRRLLTRLSHQRAAIELVLFGAFLTADKPALCDIGRHPSINFPPQLPSHHSTNTPLIIVYCQQCRPNPETPSSQSPSLKARRSPSRKMTSSKPPTTSSKPRASGAPATPQKQRDFSTERLKCTTRV